VKLHELIQQLYHEPSLITPGAHASIVQLVESRLGDGFFAVRKDGEGACGEKVKVEQMAVRNGIAYLPVGGAIGKNLTPFDRGSGAVDVNDLTNELAESEENDKVKGIILMFDSPGGMVTGTPELARVIERVKKPIYAFTEGMIASAAYWLASATDGIFATETANIGSIGVYVPFHDLTGMAEKKGIKVELIKTGKYKGMGYPGTPLTDDQRSHLQSRVDEIFTMFKTHVTAHRPKVKAETMQGQTFLGYPAQQAGLIDAVVETVAEVEALIPR
jgi:signal peptide peptidase SppA